MRRHICFLMLSAFILSTRVLAQDVTQPAGPNTEPFVFKGNSLGMTLDAFRANNNQGQVFIAFGTPDWRGKPKKGNTKAVPTPLCTDEMNGFPGDDRPLAPGEVFCNPAPGEINPDARMVAGVPMGNIGYYFFNDRLYEIDMHFAAIMYANIKSAFQGKYGPESRRNLSQYQNAFGAQWTGEILFWNRGLQEIMLNEGQKNGPGEDHFDRFTSSTVKFIDLANAPKYAPPKKPDF